MRHLGEATVRDVPGGSAVGGRPGRFVLSGIGLDPAGFARRLPQAAGGLAARLRPWAAAETNINFLGVPPGHPRYATGWAPATRDRLAAVRAHYDPRGLFGDPAVS